MTDTGWWLHHNERWFVKQDDETGDVTAESESGSFTAAYKRTWETWKSWGTWEKEVKS